MAIFVNMLLEHADASAEPQVDRVLGINNDQKHIILFRLNDKKALPRESNREEVMAAIADGRIRHVERDPYVSLESNTAELPEEHIKRRDAAWTCISGIVALPKDGAFIAAERGPAIQKAVKATGVSKRIIYWYLRRYWQGGQRKNALLPKFGNCGAPGKLRKSGMAKRGRPRTFNGEGPGINIGDSERERFEKGIRAFYENPKNPTKMALSEAFERTLARFFHRGFDVGPDAKMRPSMPPAHELPTYRQFRYWYRKQRNFAESLIAREGIRKFNLRSRGLGGDASAIASGPGAVYQIDSTKADVYLVSAYDRNKVVGRATVYLVVDVFSGMIVGFDASLENASYVCAGLAIENAASDKVAFCHQHGIEITAAEWPAQHLPEALWADRGELISKMANHLTDGLNIRVCNVPPYRADLKPFVERAFKTINDGVVHKIPGAVVKGHERGDRDYRLEASLTLAEFQQALIHFILHYNASRIEGRRPKEFMVADDVEPRPLAMWEWGIRNHSGSLHTLPPGLLRVHLLPGGEASVTEKGILFNGLYYGCERAVREQWATRARTTGRRKVPVSYDPRCAEILFLRLPNSDAIEACSLLPTNEFFAKRSWKEVEFHFSVRTDQKEASRTQDIQRAIDHRTTFDSLVKNAVAATKANQNGDSKQAKILGIRDNRKEERDRERAKLTPSIDSVPDEPSNIVPLTDSPPLTQPADGYVGVPNNLSMFRPKRSN